MNTNELICCENLPEEQRPPIPWTEVGQTFRWGRKPEALLVLVDRERFNDGEYTWKDVRELAGSEDACFLVYAGWDPSFGGHVYHMGCICFCASEFAPAELVDSGELSLVDDSGWPYWIGGD